MKGFLNWAGSAHSRVTYIPYSSKGWDLYPKWHRGPIECEKQHLQPKPFFSAGYGVFLQHPPHQHSPRDLLKSKRDSGKAKILIFIKKNNNLMLHGRRWGLGITSTCPKLSICKAKLIESSRQFATRIIVNPDCCCSLRPKSGLSLPKFVSNSCKFLEPLGSWNPELKLLHSSSSCIS